MLRSGLSLLLSLPKLVRCSTPHLCPLSYGLSNFAPEEVLRLVLSNIGSGADRPTKQKATAFPTESPGSKGKATSSLAGCSRAPVNTTDFRLSSCTRPPRPGHPRHLPPLPRRKVVEAWRRRTEGRGRDRCVRSSRGGQQEGKGGRGAYSASG